MIRPSAVASHSHSEAPSSDVSSEAVHEGASRRGFLRTAAFAALSFAGSLSELKGASIDSAADASPELGRWSRQGGEYDMTEMLARDVKHESLSSVSIVKANQALADIVTEAYSEDLGKKLTPEVRRELTTLLAVLNFVPADGVLREGVFVYTPHTEVLLGKDVSQAEIVQPSHRTWLSRIPEDLSHHAYIAARSDGINVSPRLGATRTITREDVSWRQVFQEVYPELTGSPKVMEHVMKNLVRLHGADPLRKPEKGRVLYLPRLDRVLKSDESVTTLLTLSNDKIAERIPASLRATIELEKAAYRKYICESTRCRVASEKDKSSDITKGKANSKEELPSPALAPQSGDLKDLVGPQTLKEDPNQFHFPAQLSSSAAGVELVKEFEGYFPKPYHCCAGKLTVGYGCRLQEAIDLARKQKGGLSEAEAECFLEVDLALHRGLVQKHFANIPLTQGMFDAIVSWAFNTGALESFDVYPSKQPTLHKHLAAGDYKNGLKELLKWVYYRRGGKKLVAKGLVRRRKEEYRLALGGYDEKDLPTTISQLVAKVPEDIRKALAKGNVTL